MASARPRIVPAAFRQAAVEVEITYAGHSTYFIDTPGGVRIATDYSGAYQVGRLPDVVTMNRAHSTHYTLFPDKRIPHVLHGWGEDGKPAIVSERIGDTFIRNVTTDIRRYFGDDSGADMIRDGNRSSSSRSRVSASVISAICTTSSTTAISPRSGGSTS